MRGCPGCGAELETGRAADVPAANVPVVVQPVASGPAVTSSAPISEPRKTSPPPKNRRLAVIAGLVFVAVAALVVVALTRNSTTGGKGGGAAASASPGGGSDQKTITGTRASLTMSDFSFKPTELHAKAGRTLSLTARNSADQKHNFHLEARPTRVDVDVAPGKAAGIGFIAPPKAGRYEFYCKYHRDRGMTGTLIVEE